MWGPLAAYLIGFHRLPSASRTRLDRSILIDRSFAYCAPALFQKKKPVFCCSLSSSSGLVCFDTDNEWGLVNGSWRLTRVKGVPLLIDRDQWDTLDLSSASVLLR
jgi:hypothetical protein